MARSRGLGDVYKRQSINSTRKSLTEDRAKEIGFEVVIK
jgi:hypothetical protein